MVRIIIEDQGEIEVPKEFIEPFTSEDVIELKGNQEFYNLLKKYYKMVMKRGLEEIKMRDETLPPVYQQFERVYDFNSDEMEMFREYLVPFRSIDERRIIFNKIMPMFEYFVDYFDPNLKARIYIIIGDYILRPCTLREKDKIMWNWRNNEYQDDPYEYGKGPILGHLLTEDDINWQQMESCEFVRMLFNNKIEQRSIGQWKRLLVESKYRN